MPVLCEAGGTVTPQEDAGMTMPPATPRTPDTAYARPLT